MDEYIQHIIHIKSHNCISQSIFFSNLKLNKMKIYFLIHYFKPRQDGGVDQLLAGLFNMQQFHEPLQGLVPLASRWLDFDTRGRVFEHSFVGRHNQFVVLDCYAQFQRHVRNKIAFSSNDK